MKNYEVKDIVNLPYEEIDQIQEKINEENLRLIDKAYADGRISADDRDYLREFYHDGMGVYREVYRTLYEVFRQPENTCAFNLSTGKVDTDENGKHINYGLKAVTPFTDTRLEYVDKFHNPIHVIFPKMKKADRAIEKIESEYHQDYLDDISRVVDRFFDDEDRDALVERMQNVKKSATKLRDILRLTITCKYYSDVERIKRVMTNKSHQERNYEIDPKETRDLFLRPLSENEKKYYDIKMIMHQKTSGGRPIDVEVQLKINTLYNADIRTHKIYEDVRSIEGDLALNESSMPQNEVRQKKAQIKILKNKIRTINGNAIHQYNMMVLDKARRIEDDGYRPLRIRPDYTDGTYSRCRDVIANEYLVESFDKFDPKTAFSAENEINKLAFMRMIGKIDHDFDETRPTAPGFINFAFENLTPAEKDRFDNITEIAQRYAPIIEQKISQRQQTEKLGDFKTLNPLNLANRGR